MYWIRAVAPGRSGWESAMVRVSSSHSWVRNFDMDAKLAPYQVPDAGEQIVFRQLGVDQALGQDVVVVGVDGAGHLRRQREPEPRVGVDLGLVGQQGVAAHVVVVADVDAGRRAVVL